MFRPETRAQELLEHERVAARALDERVDDVARQLAPERRSHELLARVRVQRAEHERPGCTIAEQLGKARLDLGPSKREHAQTCRVGLVSHFGQ
jgi:hypothetical protein